MEIKNSLIVNDAFFIAFQNLLKYKMPAKQCLELSSSVEEIAAQYSILKRAQRVIVEKYCLKNEDDTPKIDEKENILFETPELEKTCRQEINEIMQETFEIPLTEKIELSATEKFFPIDIRMLRDVISVEGVDIPIKTSKEIKESVELKKSSLQEEVSANKKT